MKKSFLLWVAITGLLLTLQQSLFAQEEKVANKVFYAELGGPGLIMSANFDSRFNSDSRLGLGYRLGVGYAYGTFEGKYVVTQWGGYYDHVTRTYYSIPVGLNYVFGKPDSKATFEVGAGLSLLTRRVALFCYDEEKPGHLIGHFSFMYRLMPVNGGFSFRIGLTPVIGTSGDLFPMGAVGFGYVF
jgi:hypothetical protein